MTDRCQQDIDGAGGALLHCVDTGMLKLAELLGPMRALILEAWVMRIRWLMTVQAAAS